MNSLNINNQSASYCTVRIGEVNKTSDFTVVAEQQLLPHGKVVRIPLGTLPCKYLKVTFEKGTPISVKRYY